MPPASSPLRPAAPRPSATPSAPLAALRGVVNSPEASGASSVAMACELDWWTLVGRLAALAGRWACRPLKFALVTVFAAYVAGWVECYVLPVLRFFWQIPW